MDKCTSRSERPFLRSSSVHALVASWMSRSAPAACVAALLESSSSRVSDLVRVRVRVRVRIRVRIRVRVRVRVRARVRQDDELARGALG